VLNDETLVGYEVKMEMHPDFCEAETARSFFTEVIMMVVGADF